MTYRERLLLACLPLALAPLAVFGWVARAQVSERLGASYSERVAALADVTERELTRESEAVAVRLGRLADEMAADNRLRLALLEGGAPGGGAERGYLLDWAERAMPLAGLDALRLQTEEGRILSSGHFRGEFDGTDAGLPGALADRDGRATLVRMRTAEGSILALARSRPVQVGASTFVLVGGTAVDPAFLERLGAGTGLEVSLVLPEDDESRPPPTFAYLIRDVPLPLVNGGSDALAHVRISASDAPLLALERDMNRWLLGTAAAATALAVLLALLASSRLARPLSELATKARRLNLDRLDVAFASRTDEAGELGTLARSLDRMTERLRRGAAELREAERRATTGDIARQVNHDVKNGLVPIRNVLAHLSEVANEHPEQLPEVFRARRSTLDSSVAYLQSLAANYARLTPALERCPLDVNSLVREVLNEAGAEAPASGDGRATPRLQADLAPGLPPVVGDPVALRRVVGNLVVNALQSVGGERAGTVTVTTLQGADAGEPHVRITVADDGPGIDPALQAKVFDDFYTTRQGGTGLGLSIVRRLVSDLGGRVELESEPGQGARFTVLLPAGAASADPGAHSPREPHATS